MPANIKNGLSNVISAAIIAGSAALLVTMTIYLLSKNLFRRFFGNQDRNYEKQEDEKEIQLPENEASKKPSNSVKLPETFNNNELAI